MRFAPLSVAVVLCASACVGPITEYNDEAANDDPSGDGDGDPSDESGTNGDGDGEPTGDGNGDGDGDGEPTGEGDGDGDCTADCACEAVVCDPGFGCVEGRCELLDYPWGKCGWNADEEWYECGYQGESPDPQFPIDCGDQILVSGAKCPDGFTVEGCCRYGGDAWWCQGGFVMRKPCGA
jgi:hypothetical protein